MLANDRWDLIRRLKGCMKNQQIHQLFIQFINYVWQLLHVLALHCHLQGVFLVPSERCSIEEQSIEYCGWACCVSDVVRGAHHVTKHNTTYKHVAQSAFQKFKSPVKTCVKSQQIHKLFIQFINYLW